MKKVLIVTALAGFIRSFLNSDIETLQEKGYEVSCIANLNHNGNDNITEYFKARNITIYNVPFNSSNPFDMNNLKSYLFIKKHLKSIHYDMIHVHTPIAGAITRLAAKKYFRKNLKVIYTTHGLPFLEKRRGLKEKIFYFIEKIMSKYTSSIVTINKQDFDLMSKISYCKVHYIHGVGVKLEKFCYSLKECLLPKDIYIDYNKVNILMIGELSNRKNHILTLKAINMLNEKEKFAVYICGIDMSNSGIKEILKEYSTLNNIEIHFLGLRKDINLLCPHFSFGVLPSKREGLGLSGIEMIASGLPLLGSNVQGIKDYIIPNVNGLLFENDDAIDLCNKLKEIQNIKFDRHKLKETVLQFDKSVNLNEMNQIYDLYLDDKI